MNESENNYTSENQTTETAAYKSAMKGQVASRGWSVASLILSIVSLICCCFPWGGMVFAVLGIIFAIVSRKRLGYFDGLAVAGLITAIFSIVIMVFVLVCLNYVIELIKSNPELYEQYKDLLDKINNGQS